MIIYIASLVLFFVFYLSTLPYKQRVRKKLDKKEHKLWMLYGMAMFILDKVPQRKQRENSTINKAMQEIHIKEDIQKERYLYFTEKIAISILFLLMTLLIGMGVTWSENRESNQQVKELRREELLEETYNLVVENNEKETEEVQLTLKGRIKTEKELQKILAENKEQLIKKFLGENKSLNHITKDVNLISTIEQENILVIWEISDSSIVNYEGKISENPTDEGTSVQFIATMTLEEVSMQMEINTVIYPSEQVETLEEKIQSYLNEADESKEKVKLPQKIDGERISFFQQADQTGKWILPVGVVLSVLLFFFKDKDLKKKLSERNEQMESDYPELIGQILLYYRAGLSLSSTIDRIVSEYKEDKKGQKNYFRYAYEELEVVRTKIRSGISEIQAIIEFGQRCGLQNYMRLAGIIEQNQRRGTKELVVALQTEQRSALAERKNQALRMGSEISTKLLGPMIIMLIVTMTIVVVPSFLSMNLN